MVIILLGKVTIFLREGTWTLPTKFVTLPSRFMTLSSTKISLPTKNFIGQGHNYTGYTGRGCNVIGQGPKFADKCIGQSQIFPGQGRGRYHRGLG